MRPLYKDFFRGILKNKGKFISVFFIILLGAAFFSGLRSSKNDMLFSAENYYDAQHLFDISVVSTAGLTDDDVSALEALDEVSYAEGVNSLDVLCNTEEKRAVKLISLSQRVNVPVVDGTLPKNSDECLLDALLLELGTYKTGDKIQFLSGGEDDLSGQLVHTEYTITGFADLPQYMDLSRGTGTVGNGEIDGFVLVSSEAFTADYYTQINVLVEGAEEKDSFEEEYDNLIDGAKESINSIADEACARRYEELKEQYAGLPIPPEALEELIPEPEWYVVGRETVFSYVNYRSDADRIASLGELLPIVFFLVAALVSLTAMTRMVEEERQQIGTLKALGCGNGSVLARYLCYALIPTLTGSVVGVLIGEKLFPLAILNTYALLYQGLTSFVLPYNFVEGAIAVAASVLSTGVATVAACLSVSRSCPAQIMRPEAPKPGKRVLIERIPFIWKRLSFTQKSTVRNMFRNKKRFLMTIIGVAGCMGLVLVGLGLQDSIMDVADMQYTDLTHYKASVTVQEGIPDEDRYELMLGIEGQGEGVKTFSLYQKSVDVQGRDGIQTVTLCVPESLDGIEDYFTFRYREGKQSISISPEGGIISEKTARSLGVWTGDSVTFRDGNSDTVTVKITAVYENYIGHYLFIDSGLYEELFMAEPSCNQILVAYPSATESFESSLGSYILENDAVQGVSFTSALVEWADDTLSSLNTIVLIVLAAAALLAIVVLYNLNSINIAERKRELATLKVLGFYDKEVAVYVYKENVLLTVIGILLGVGLGVLLHQYVIKSIEVDLIMFGRSIYWYSYIIGGLITLAFSVIINLVMYKSLQKIDMIESLKSIE